MAPTHIQKKVKKRRQIRTYAEPKRKNLLDIINENMALAVRHIFIHRLIYIGRHTFSPGELNNSSYYFQGIIEAINAEYCDEFLTGYFLHYPRYFCHVIEGSELSLKKHLHLMFTIPEVANNIDKPKLLVAYHHVNQRFLNVWTQLTARPPTLLEKIDVTTDLQNTTSKVVNCVQKLYKLGLSLRTPPEASKSEDSEDSSSVHDQLSSRLIKQVKSTISNFEDIGKPSEALPEYSLLEFLTGSQYVRDLKEYADSFGAIPVLQKYEDMCWPALADYVPKNVFDSDYDPVTDLPSKEQEEDPDLI